MLPTFLAHGLPPKLVDPSTGSTIPTQKAYLHQTNAHTLIFLKRPSILQIAVNLSKFVWVIMIASKPILTAHIVSGAFKAKRSSWDVESLVYSRNYSGQNFGGIFVGSGSEELSGFFQACQCRKLRNQSFGRPRIDSERNGTSINISCPSSKPCGDLRRSGHFRQSCSHGL